MRLDEIINRIRDDGPRPRNESKHRNYQCAIFCRGNSIISELIDGIQKQVPQPLRETQSGSCWIIIKEKPPASIKIKTIK